MPRDSPPEPGPLGVSSTVMPPRATIVDPPLRMDFLLDLLQGAGIAAAVGIRPFLPVLLVGALASADLGIDFNGTPFAFMEEWPFLLAVLILVMLLELVARRRTDVDTGPIMYALLM